MRAPLPRPLPRPACIPAASWLRLQEWEAAASVVGAALTLGWDDGRDAAALLQLVPPPGAADLAHVPEDATDAARREARRLWRQVTAQRAASFLRALALHRAQQAAARAAIAEGAAS